MQSRISFEKIDSNTHERIWRATSDRKGSDLDMIIAIHNTKSAQKDDHGRSICFGDCRVLNYSNDNDFLNDAKNLSQGMSRKNVLAGLPSGGSKCVVQASNEESGKNEDLYKDIGEAVSEFNKSEDYVIYTGEDVGLGEVGVNKMKEIAPSYIVGSKKGSGSPGEPTALGVYHSMKSISDEVFGNGSLEGKRVSVLGLGGVGGQLLNYLYNEGAEAVIADKNQVLANEYAQKYGFTLSSPERIYEVGCEIFSPNSPGSTLEGGALNEKRLDSIHNNRISNNAIIVGSSNVMFTESGLERKANEHEGLVSVPSIISNSGGVIHVYNEIMQEPQDKVKEKIRGIGNTVSDFYKNSVGLGVNLSEYTYRRADDLIRQGEVLGPSFQR